MSIYRLKNSIQHYPWGSPTLIPQLMGVENQDNIPFAEVWMGAHPKAPSMVVTDTAELTLNELIAGDPERILGQHTAESFQELPFLFKFLAAGEPLSIQAHPSKRQAEAGYARENREGPAIDAPDRNYRDDNHKPEIMTALTPFWALRGFRSAEEIVSFADELGAPRYRKIARLAASVGLEAFFSTLMRYEEPGLLIGEILSAAEGRSGAVWEWLSRLNEFYPNDIAVAAPLYLNLLRLEPGEALYLAAGELHAYLEGLGIELMANSDNVLRGGLTVKHVDLNELLRVLTFSKGAAERLEAVRLDENGVESVFSTPAREFTLSRITLGPDSELMSRPPASCQILVCAEGMVTVDGRLELTPGQSLFITADQEAYSLKGEGLIFKASVPG